MSQIEEEKLLKQKNWELGQNPNKANKQLETESIEAMFFKQIDLDRYQRFLHTLKQQPDYKKILQEIQKKIEAQKTQISLTELADPSSFSSGLDFAGALTAETERESDFAQILEKISAAASQPAETSPVLRSALAIRTEESQRTVSGPETGSAFARQLLAMVDNVLDQLAKISPKLYKASSAVLMALVLAACSAGAFPPSGANPELQPATPSSQSASGEAIDPPATTTEAAAKPAPEITQTVSAEELSRLSQEIGEKLDTAVDQADPAIQLQFEDEARTKNIADAFAKSLTDPENPEQRVLDPRAFRVGLTPDGAAYLMLTVDSPWGKANEVAIVDTGKDRGMFVTVPGSGVINGKLVFDQAGVYVAATDELGQVKKVVDATYQWVTPDQAEKLNSAGVWGRVVDAYLAGEISYPKDLSPEQKNEFERALVEAEAKLPVAEQKKLIEGRFDRSKSGVYEAVIKADGNLEYFDGSWKTLEAMRNQNGEIIPWGESYDVVSEEGREGMLKDLFGGEEAWMAEMDRYIATQKVNAENTAKRNNFSVDTSKFNKRYVTFYFGPENLKLHEGKKIPYYTLDGLTVLKNPLTNRLLISKITAFMNQAIYIHEGPYTTGFSSYDVITSNFFDQKAGFFTINSKEILEKFPYSADDRRIKWSQEENFPAFETMWASHLEDFEEKLRKDPDKIQDGLYNFTDLLFPYKE